MRNLILLFLSLTFLSACAKATAEKEDLPITSGLTIEEAMVTKKDGVHFKRVALVVSDIDRSLTIYRDALGFEPNTISSSEPDSFGHHVFGAPGDAQMRFVSLNTNQEMRVLALSEVKGVDLTPARIAPSPYSAVHVIEVVNHKESMDNIKALGLPVTDYYEADYDGYGVKEQGFTDFDGHQIVLYELIPHDNG